MKGGRGGVGGRNLGNYSANKKNSDFVMQEGGGGHGRTGVGFEIDYSSE